MTQAFLPEHRERFLQRLEAMTNSLQAERDELRFRRDQLLAETVDVADWMIERMYKLVERSRGAT